MKRRIWAGFLCGLLPVCAWALSLGDFSDRQATDGLRQTLVQAGSEAVAGLGKTDGFLGNPKVKIPCPAATGRNQVKRGS